MLDSPRPEARRSWIFGYGSLIWRPGFPFGDRRPCLVRGYRRRFWQGSTDHRGTPERPGRVVTLIPDEDSDCWGVAYGVDRAALQEITGALDHREKGGYERRWLSVYADGQMDTPFARALTYLATPDNERFLGPAPLEGIAAQVREAVGPSGENSDYVLRLAESLREMGAYDPHVFELEALLR